MLVPTVIKIIILYRLRVRKQPNTKLRCLVIFDKGKPGESSDSDFADCPKTRKSTTGFIFYLNGAPVAWTSRIQKLVTLSSTEAEYVAASEACCEGIWLSKMCQFLGLESHPLDLREDNTGVIARCVSPTYVFQRRSKHIEVKYHFLNEQVKEGNATIEYVNTHENPADVMTKSLPPCEFKKKVPLLVVDLADKVIPSS